MSRIYPTVSYPDQSCYGLAILEIRGDRIYPTVSYPDQSCYGLAILEIAD